MLSPPTQTVQSAAIINQFIEEVTKGTIKDVLTPEDLFLAQMVLVNAVYFKGTWKTQFKASDTRDMPFLTLNPSFAPVYVPMMSTERKMKYGKCCIPLYIAYCQTIRAMFTFYFILGYSVRVPDRHAKVIGWRLRVNLSNVTHR